MSSRYLTDLRQRKSKIIHVYRNGDKFTRAALVLLKPLEQKELERIFNAIEEKLTLQNNKPIKRMFTIEGDEIEKSWQIEDQSYYVVGSAETFIKTHYGTTHLWNILGPVRWSKCRNVIYEPPDIRERRRSRSAFDKWRLKVTNSAAASNKMTKSMSAFTGHRKVLRKSKSKELIADKSNYVRMPISEPSNNIDAGNRDYGFSGAKNEHFEPSENSQEITSLNTSRQIDEFPNDSGDNSKQDNIDNENDLPNFTQNGRIHNFESTNGDCDDILPYDIVSRITDLSPSTNNDDDEDINGNSMETEENGLYKVDEEENHGMKDKEDDLEVDTKHVMNGDGNSGGLGINEDDLEHEVENVVIHCEEDIKIDVPLLESICPGYLQNEGTSSDNSSEVEITVDEDHVIVEDDILEEVLQECMISPESQRIGMSQDDQVNFSASAQEDSAKNECGNSHVDKSKDNSDKDEIPTVESSLMKQDIVITIREGNDGSPSEFLRKKDSLDSDEELLGEDDEEDTKAPIFIQWNSRSPLLKGDFSSKKFEDQSNEGNDYDNNEKVDIVNETQSDSICHDRDDKEEKDGLKDEYLKDHFLNLETLDKEEDSELLDDECVDYDDLVKNELEEVRDVSGDEFMGPAGHKDLESSYKNNVNESDLGNKEFDDHSDADDSNGEGLKVDGEDFNRLTDEIKKGEINIDYQSGNISQDKVDNNGNVEVKNEFQEDQLFHIKRHEKDDNNSLEDELGEVKNVFDDEFIESSGQKGFESSYEDKVSETDLRKKEYVEHSETDDDEKNSSHSNGDEFKVCDEVEECMQNDDELKSIGELEKVEIDNEEQNDSISQANESNEGNEGLKEENLQKLDKEEDSDLVEEGHDKLSNDECGDDNDSVKDEIEELRDVSGDEFMGSAGQKCMDQNKENDFNYQNSDELSKTDEDEKYSNNSNGDGLMVDYNDIERITNEIEKIETDKEDNGRKEEFKNQYHEDTILNFKKNDKEEDSELDEIKEKLSNDKCVYDNDSVKDELEEVRNVSGDEFMISKGRKDCMSSYEEFVMDDNKKGINHSHGDECRVVDEIEPYMQSDIKGMADESEKEEQSSKMYRNEYISDEKGELKDGYQSDLFLNFHRNDEERGSSSLDEINEKLNTDECVDDNDSCKDEPEEARNVYSNEFIETDVHKCLDSSYEVKVKESDPENQEFGDHSETEDDEKNSNHSYGGGLNVSGGDKECMQKDDDLKIITDEINNEEESVYLRQDLDQNNGKEKLKDEYREERTMDFQRNDKDEEKDLLNETNVKLSIDECVYDNDSDFDKLEEVRDVSGDEFTGSTGQKALGSSYEDRFEAQNNCYSNGDMMVVVDERKQCNQKDDDLNEIDDEDNQNTDSSEGINNKIVDIKGIGNIMSSSDNIYDKNSIERYPSQEDARNIDLEEINLRYDIHSDEHNPVDEFNVKDMTNDVIQSHLKKHILLKGIDYSSEHINETGTDSEERDDDLSSEEISEVEDHKDLIINGSINQLIENEEHHNMKIEDEDMTNVSTRSERSDQDYEIKEIKDLHDDGNISDCYRNDKSGDENSTNEFDKDLQSLDQVLRNDIGYSVEKNYERSEDEGKQNESNVTNDEYGNNDENYKNRRDMNSEKYVFSEKKEEDRDLHSSTDESESDDDTGDRIVSDVDQVICSKMKNTMEDIYENDETNEKISQDIDEDEAGNDVEHDDIETFDGPDVDGDKYDEAVINNIGDDQVVAIDNDGQQLSSENDEDVSEDYGSSGKYSKRLSYKDDDVEAGSDHNEYLKSKITSNDLLNTNHD